MLAFLLGPIGRWLVAGLLAVIALGGLYWKVDHGGYVRGKAEVELKWQEADRLARQREAERSAAAAKDLANARAKRKIVVQERTVYVDRIVDRPVYRNQCLDAAGLRCLAGAIEGKSAAGCKPDGAVPPAPPTR